MIALGLLVIALMIMVEITRVVNNPLDMAGIAESIKFQPEWSHIHSCDSGC